MADRADPADHQEKTANATPTAEPARVFVSYASPDVAVAGALVEALERHGISCWIAPRDVKAGAVYADAIVRAISSAKALVLVLSENAIGSSHVGKEVERASSKKRPIIALRVDKAPLTPALEYFLSESQWIEAQDEKKEPAYARLIDAIQELEQAAPGTGRSMTPPAGTGPATRPTGRRKRIPLAVLLSVVAVALVALLADRAWLAKQLAADQPTTAATSAVSIKSIAVLPFTDMSEKHDQEYFADGIAEEVLDRLAKVPGLKVVGRASSFQFKGKSADAAGIGTALGVAYLLEGSVRKEVGRVRVTAQLVEARSGAQRWSDRFDSDEVDMLQV